MLLLTFQKRLTSGLLSKLGPNFDPNDEHDIENNLLKMDIYYKEFNFENIVETPGYSVCIQLFLIVLSIMKLTKLVTSSVNHSITPVKFS